MSSKQRLLELNARLAQNLTAKGVNATADETTTALINKVAEIPSGDNSALISLIERTATEFTIPDGVTNIGDYALSHLPIVELIIPPSVKTFGQYACANNKSLKSIDFGDITGFGSSSGTFSGCTALTSVGSEKITSLGYTTFSMCSNLVEANFPNLTHLHFGTFNGCSSLEKIEFPLLKNFGADSTFAGCTSLKTFLIPKTVTYGLFASTFRGCTALEFVTIEEGFDCNNLNLSASTKYSVETIVSWLEALADRTGKTAYTLTIGAANLAKLTEEQIAIATNKNWTLA